MDRLKGDQRGSGRSWYVVWGLRCHKKWRVKITRSEEPSPPPTHHGTTRGTTRRNAEAHNHVYTHTHTLCVHSSSTTRCLHYTYYTYYTHSSTTRCLHYTRNKRKSAKTDNLHSVMLLVLRSLRPLSTQVRVRTARGLFLPMWIRQNRNYSNNNCHAPMWCSNYGRLRNYKEIFKLQSTN